MGTDEANDNSLISDRIELLMVKARLRSRSELARKTGINRATISLKLNNHRRWTIEDLRQLAPVLGTTVSHLLGDDKRPDGSTPHPERRMVMDPQRRAEELDRRVKYLLAHAADRSAFEQNMDVQALLSSGRGASSPETLRVVADLFDVPVDYLLDTDDIETAARVEAEIELGVALAEGGVLNVASRSLGQMSAEELNAITRIIREYGSPKGDDEQRGGD